MKTVCGHKAGEGGHGGVLPTNDRNSPGMKHEDSMQRFNDRVKRNIELKANPLPADWIAHPLSEESLLASQKLLVWGRFFFGTFLIWRVV
jgi:hypothetical protein